MQNNQKESHASSRKYDHFYLNLKIREIRHSSEKALTY